MSILEALKEKLTRELDAEHVEIVDDSWRHAGHREGGESHFRVRIVSSAFADRSRVDRHRMVNEALAPAFARGVQALAIEASAPGESTRW